MISNFVGSKPLSGAVSKITSKYLYFPFHEASGATAEDKGTLAPGNLAIAGTTTAIWNNRGFITPAGDNNIALSTASYASFFDCPTLDAKGGLLIAYRFRPDVHATTVTQRLFSSTPFHTANGGFEVYLSTNGAHNFHFQEAGNSVTYEMGTGAISTGTEFSILLYIDLVNDVITLYKDGSQSSTKSISGNSLPKPGLAFDSQILAQSAGGGAQNFLGSDGATSLLESLFVARVEKDISADIGKLATAWRAGEKELPREFGDVL